MALTPSMRFRDLLMLAAFSLVLNGVVGLITTQPGYMDAYYYFNGGTFIAHGEWTEPYIWNFVSLPPSLPAPAFSYWQPIPSILSAIGIRLLPFLLPFDAAQVPFLILAAALPPIAYLVGSQLGDRRIALCAGLLTILSGYYVIYWSLTSTITPFAVAGASALALAGWGRSDSRWWRWLAAGCCAALAHLTRADGLLFVPILLITALILRPQRPILWRASDTGLVFAGYVVVMLAWWLRNLAAYGSIQASGGLSTLWALHYNDLFNYPPTLSIERYFAAGWEAMLRPKWEALKSNTSRLIAELNLVFLFPFTLIGMARRWRQDFLLPAILYGASLFAAMTFAFTWPGMQGGWFHSASALIPFVMSAAILGIDDAVTWLGRRRGWRVVEARRFFGFSAIMLALLVTGFALGRLFQWNARTSEYFGMREVLGSLDVPADVPVVVSNTPAFYYFTGHGGIPTPTNGGEDVLLKAADDYEIEYVVIDPGSPEGLHYLLDGEPESPRLELLGRGETYAVYRINP